MVVSLPINIGVNFLVLYTNHGNKSLFKSHEKQEMKRVKKKEIKNRVNTIVKISMAEDNRRSICLEYRGSPNDHELLLPRCLSLFGAVVHLRRVLEKKMA